LSIFVTVLYNRDGALGIFSLFPSKSHLARDLHLSSRPCNRARGAREWQGETRGANLGVAFVKVATVSLAFSLFVLSFASDAGATPITLTATLNGANESPPNGSAGTGSVLVQYDNAAHTLGLQASFSGLSSPDNAAHIHCCTAVPFAGTGPVATTVPAFAGFPLNVTSGAFNNLLAPYDLTQAAFWNPAFITANGGTPASAELVFAAGLTNGTEYFNIHTVNFPGGEIRGFLVGVPEPMTLALFGAGLVGIGAMCRRQRGTKQSA
jgi:hypothetical protein